MPILSDHRIGIVHKNSLFIHKQKIMVDLPGGVFYTLSDTEKGRRRIVLCGYISNMFYQ